MELLELHIPINRDRTCECDNCSDRFICFTCDEIIIKSYKQTNTTLSLFIGNIEAEFEVPSYLWLRKCFPININISDSIFLKGKLVYVSSYEIHGWSSCGARVIVNSKIPL